MLNHPFLRANWVLCPRIAATSIAIFLATAVAVSIDQADAATEHDSLAAAAGSITVDQLRGHIDVLADDTLEGRQAGSRGGHAAAHYLIEQLRHIGLTPAGPRGRFDQPFGSGYRNLLGMIAGRDPALARQVVIIGAHYDHVGYGNQQTSYGPIGYIHNGADDNASGTAALLEIAEACMELPFPPRRTILFALWDGEEQGLLGSWHWVGQPTLPLERVALVINMDMVGRLGRDGLQVYGTRSSWGLRQLVSRENQTIDLPLQFPWNTVDDSDHFPFFLRDVPFLMFHTGLHEDYHRPSDDAERINLQGTRDVTRLVLNVLFRVAEGPHPEGFRVAARRESQSAQREFERPLPPLPPRLGVEWNRSDEADTGLVLKSVATGSAADQSGLRVGDRLVRFAGHEVADDDDAFRHEVLRASNSSSVLVERPGTAEPVELEVRLPGRPLRLGIAWREDDAEPAAVALSRVVAGLPADRAGLKTWDRIYEIAGRRFADSAEFRDLVTSLPFPLEVLVERKGRMRSLTLYDSPAAGRQTPEELATYEE